MPPAREQEVVASPKPMRGLMGLVSFSVRSIIAPERAQKATVSNPALSLAGPKSPKPLIWAQIMWGCFLLMAS